jgi:hypothetical protein
MTRDEFFKAIEAELKRLDFKNITPDKMRKCTCGDPMCDLYYFDNGFTGNLASQSPKNENSENLIKVDFVNRKRL